MAGARSRGAGKSYNIWLPDDMVEWADSMGERLNCSRGEMITFALEMLKDDHDFLETLGFTPERVISFARILGRLRGALQAKGMTIKEVIK